ncbi:DUF4350 domain-containing protein [Lysobacter tyrosinilyticus]
MNAKRAGRPSLLVVLLVLLGLVAAFGLIGWWLHTHERVQRVVDMPRTGEARRNPLFALQVALEKDGIAVKSRRRLQLFTEGAREPVVPLAPRDTLVLYNDPRALSTREVDALLQWVGNGGHLIVRTPPLGLLARNSPVPLLGKLQLLALDQEHSGCEDVTGAHAHPMDTAEAVAKAVEMGDEGSGLMFCGARRFTLTGANPVHSWGDLQNGYVFARVQRGRGSVDVLADLDFLGTDNLDDAASYQLTRQLLQPNHDAGTVHLVYATQMPSLWATIIRHSWMAWAPLLLALAFWLWRRMQRFGPAFAAPTLERRSLLEHITASGELAYRYGYAHLLYDAARNAFLSCLRRRDPQAAALQGEPQLMLLAERFKDVPASEIRDALLPPFANDHTAFRTRIATLIRLRNRL